MDIMIKWSQNVPVILISFINQECSYQCLTCETEPTNCTVCTGTNRSANWPDCECEPGYYNLDEKSDCES
jgi:hypothetical protein